MPSATPDVVYTEIYRILFGETHDTRVEHSLSTLEASGVQNIQTYRSAFLAIVKARTPNSSTIKQYLLVAAAHQSRRRQLVACKKVESRVVMDSVETFMQNAICSNTTEMSETKFPAVKVACSFPEMCMILAFSSKSPPDCETIVKKHWLASVDLTGDAREKNKAAYMEHWSNVVKLSAKQKKENEDKNVPESATIYSQSEADKLKVVYNGKTYTPMTMAKMGELREDIIARVAALDSGTQDPARPPATPPATGNPPPPPPPETPHQVSARLVEALSPQVSEAIETKWANRFEKSATEDTVWAAVWPMTNIVAAELLRTTGLRRTRDGFSVGSEVYSGPDATHQLISLLEASTAVTAAMEEAAENAISALTPAQ